MIPITSVNWIAVLVGTIFSMFLGAMWYGPLFGKLWMRWIDKPMEELESNPLNYVKTALAAFFSMLALNIVVLALGSGNFIEGLLVGGLAFVGFGATATFVYTTFEGPPEKVWFLYSVYQILVFLVMGGVFAVWR